MLFNTPSRILLALIAFTACASATPAHRPGDAPPPEDGVKRGNVVLDAITAGEIMRFGFERGGTLRSDATLPENGDLIYAFTNDINLLVDSETRVFITLTNIPENLYGYFLQRGSARLTYPQITLNFPGRTSMRLPEEDITGTFGVRSGSLTTLIKILVKRRGNQLLLPQVGLTVEFHDFETAEGQHYADLLRARGGIEANFRLTT